MANEDRLFNPHGRRHFRRTYRVGEVWVGLAIVAGLAAIAAWVAYKGAHPDPELFGRDPRLIPKGSPAVGVLEDRTGPSLGSGPGGQASAPDLGRFADVGGAQLAPKRFRVASTSRFGPENLFEKINGREGFYKSRGFRALHFASMRSLEGEAIIDIEWFDLGTAAQALGAFSAERADGATVESVSGGSHYLYRNMAAVVRGPNYIRLVGIDETPVTQTALRALTATFEAELAGTELPWSYAFFGQLDIPSAEVSIEPSEAFSFSFARNVHLGINADDVELFITPRPDGDASTHAERYLEGFATLGKKTGSWVKDRYLDTFSTAAARGDQFVIGVRGAPNVKTGASLLEALGAGLDALPEAARAQALAGEAADPPPDDGEGEYSDESAPAEEETY
ncbi:MAG: DUF6599 family protein [Myxococcota bacterium]